MKSLVLSSLAITLACAACDSGSRLSQKNTEVDVRVQNESSQHLDDWWIDCGNGYVNGIGNIGPKIFKEIGFMPATAGSTVSFKYQFTGGQIIVTNNVLGRPLGEKESITLVVTDTGVQFGK